MAEIVANRAAAKPERAAVRAEAEEAVTTDRAEAEKPAEDEFGACFFQGYSDLKRRVALAHPEWDLSAFSRVDSNYWEAEVLVGVEDPLGEVGTDSTKGENPIVKGGEVSAHTVEKTQATGKTEETVLIVDDGLGA